MLERKIWNSVRCAGITALTVAGMFGASGCSGAIQVGGGKDGHYMGDNGKCYRTYCTKTFEYRCAGRECSYDKCMEWGREVVPDVYCSYN